jgi:hypothetical protein
VKEKTVNKFFYFKPERRELFDSIYDRKDEKYKILNDYREDIFNAVDETEELNARIYIQVLDNCLEWIDKGYSGKVLRTLVLNTVCFVQNNFILSYYKSSKIRQANTDYSSEHVDYDEIKYEHEINNFFRKRFSFSDLESEVVIKNKVSNFFNDLNEHITGVKSNDSRIRITVEMQKILLDEIDDRFDEMQSILNFGYKLFVAKNIEKHTYEDISDFIKSGILLKNKDIK